MKSQSGKKSIICQYIESNPKTWESDFKEKGISIKRAGNLAIFNYGIACDFHDPIVQEARGIIIDIKFLNVICWPFRKFGNWQESYADEIDWESARAFEKIDGSIIKAYFYNDKWSWATNSCIHASEANCQNGGTFQDLIDAAVNKKNIPFNTLDKTKTYIFELVSPENKLVIKYNKTYLYHIGTRSNITGEEFDDDIGIEKPKCHQVKDLASCVHEAEELNADGKVTEEGYVIVDKYWRRIKVKSPLYFKLHAIRHNGDFSKKRIIEILSDGDDLKDIFEQYPEVIHLFKYYDYRLSELEYKIDQFMDYAKALYEEYSYDKKSLVFAIKDHPYAFAALKGLNGRLQAKDILERMPKKKLLDMIPDYKKDC